MGRGHHAACAAFALLALFSARALLAGDLEQADQLFAESRFAQARDAYTKVLESGPNAQACWKRAHCLEQLGDTAGAVKDYERAIEADKTLYDAYYDKALLEANVLQKPDDALATLSLAIKNGYRSTGSRDPLARIHVLRSYMLSARKDLPGAIKDMTHALYLVPSAENFFLRGELHMKSDASLEAKKDYKKALRVMRESGADDPELRRNIEDSLAGCEEQLGEDGAPPDGAPEAAAGEEEAAGD